MWDLFVLTGPFLFNQQALISRWRTLNLDGGTLNLDGGMRPPYDLSTGIGHVLALANQNDLSGPPDFLLWIWISLLLCFAVCTVCTGSIRKNKNNNFSAMHFVFSFSNWSFHTMPFKMTFSIILA